MILTCSIGYGFPESCDTQAVHHVPRVQDRHVRRLIGMPLQVKVACLVTADALKIK